MAFGVNWLVNELFIFHNVKIAGMGDMGGRIGES
jgi:hypothetical protein